MRGLTYPNLTATQYKPTEKGLRENAHAWDDIAVKARTRAEFLYALEKATVIRSKLAKLIEEQR